MNYLKPSFSNHPLNYILALVIGFFAFFFTSFALAYTTNTFGPYETSAQALSACYAYRDSSIIAPDVVGSNCVSSTTNYLLDRRGPLNQGSTLKERSWFMRPTVEGECPVDHTADGNGLCVPPPPPPSNCTDLQGQSFQKSYEGTYAPLEICNFGCSAFSGVTVYIGGYTGTDYTYSGTSCPGGTGYDSTKGEDEPEYDPEAPPKICKDASGYIYGSVSANAECPIRQNCYDDATGSFVGTADGSTSCSAGTSTNAERDWSDNTATGQTSETTTNPDGSTETNTETTTQHTGSDGKSYSTTSNSTTTCDAQGTCSTSTSTTEAQATCLADNCPDGMAEPMVGEVTNCTKAFQCSGDIMQCTKLELEWEKACAYISDESIEAWITSDEYTDNVKVSTNQFGQLTVLDGGTTDVSAALDVPSWMVDDNITATCPEVINGWIELDMTPLCGFFSAMRYPVLFFNAFAIFGFFRRSLLEN